MCEFLPTGNFKWDSETWTSNLVSNLDDEGKTGYLFEVDLHYPKELHKLHNGYALASENKAVKKECLNEWQKENYKESNIKKLLTSFHDKNNYVVNYRLLKLFISLGLIVTKFHRVISYDQDNYMKSYIMKNTNERSKATNDFDKDFYKLMNNSVYGKTMGNVRNRINFELYSNEKRAISRRNDFKRFTIVNKNLVGVHLAKNKLN